jgi:L-malate glycosyltransferase
VNVHQVLAGAGPHDGVTLIAGAYRGWFRRWGWGGCDHATYLAPGLDGAVISRERLEPAPGDVLVLHHSAAMPRLGELLALPNRKLLVYHNITPAAWLWEVAPLLAVQCAVGREQLLALLAGVDAAAAVSEFNAAELRAAGAGEVAVLGPLLSPGRLRDPGGGTAPHGGSPADGAGARVLFVGRLSPHKRQDELIRAFALYRRHHDPGARLTLAGDPITSAYGDRLRALAAALAPGAVRFERSLSDAELAARYRAAGAFACLSEHEGFCLPLLEALAFGLPVLARAAAAVPETAGDAALLLDGDDDLAVVAEGLRAVLEDAALRAELRRRAAARLAVHDPAVAAPRLRALIERVGAHRGP